MEKKFVEYNGKMVEAYDMTPTWEGLLPMMLEVYAQQYQKAYKSGHTEGQAENFKGMKEEFKKMAKAADKWNAHCKEQEGRKPKVSYPK